MDYGEEKRSTHLEHGDADPVGPLAVLARQLREPVQRDGPLLAVFALEPALLRTDALHLVLERLAEVRLAEGAVVALRKARKVRKHKHISIIIIIE